MPGQTSEDLLALYDSAPLSRRYWVIFAIISAITVLEFFDFSVVAFLLAVVGPRWHLTYGQSALILYAGGVGSIVGALVFGSLAPQCLGAQDRNHPRHLYLRHRRRPQRSCPARQLGIVRAAALRRRRRSDRRGDPSLDHHRQLTPTRPALPCAAFLSCSPPPPAGCSRRRPPRRSSPISAGARHRHARPVGHPVRPSGVGARP